MLDRRTFTTALGACVPAAALAGCTVAARNPAARPGGANGTPTAAVAARPLTSFGTLKHVRAGVLDIGYAEAGPANGPAVVLLHGWPYDIHSYVDVAPLLAAQGYRVVVPYLRGHGTTRFLSASTPRDAEQVVFALDILALMDALHIDSAVLGGFDWGSRTADIIAALWPDRCKALVSVTGYLITDVAADKQPLPPRTEWAWWYQYYFATARGERGLRKYRHDLAKLVWSFNSPTWHFSDATFDRTATAFDNPDYVPIVIGNYRMRLGLVKGERRYAAQERALAGSPAIAVPAVTLDGERDPFTPPGNGSSYRAKFTGPYLHRTLAGIGHNVPQEAPGAFAEAVVDADRMARRKP
jgi:pimeloyl-ACP methyl ester carboxylesterase